MVIVNSINYKNAVSKEGYEAQSITQDLLSWWDNLLSYLSYTLFLH